MKRLLLALLLLAACAAPSAAQFADQATFAGTGAGSANAQTITLSNVTALSDIQGVLIKFVPGATNTGATTLAVSGLTATNIRKPAPGFPLLTGGELVSGTPATVMYDGTRFVLLSVPGNVGTAATVDPSALAYTVPTNLGLAASAATGNLNITFTGAVAGLSASNPALFLFSGGASTSANPTSVSMTSVTPFSILSGNTMGCVSGNLCRLWILAANNGGTVVVCARNSNNGQVPLAIIEGNLITTTGTSGGSLVGTTYCSSAVTNAAFRIVGYLEAVETGGVWASPTVLQVFGPGIKKPGDLVQAAIYTSSTAVSFTNSSLAQLSGQQVTMTLTSAANLVRVSFASSITTVGTNATVAMQISRGTLGSGGVALAPVTTFSAPAAQSAPVSTVIYDRPGATSVTYEVNGAINGGTSAFSPSNSAGGSVAAPGTVLLIEEIQG